MLVKIIKKYKFTILRLLNTRRSKGTQKTVEFLFLNGLTLFCGRHIAIEAIKCSDQDNKKLVRSSFHFLKYSLPKLIDVSTDRFYNPVMFGFDSNIARNFYLKKQQKHQENSKISNNLNCELFLTDQLNQSSTSNFNYPKEELEEKRLALSLKVSDHSKDTNSLPINQTTSHPPKGSARPLLEEALVAFYEDIQTSYDQIFAISGTFLGIVREGHLLDHDYDLDFGVKEDADIQQIVTQVNRISSFELKALERADWGFYSKDCMIKLVHKNGINLDIFIHVERDGLIFHGGSRNVWFNTPFELKTYKCCGIDVLGPAAACQYLTENYGDWRSEKKDFDYNTDTPNYFLPHTPFSNYADQKKAVNK